MKELAKNRSQLLGLFLTNPQRWFYMNEIARSLGKKVGVFQRTLNNLEKEGVLVSEYRANSRFFKADTNYPLYKELKSIVFKTVGIAGRLRQAVEKTGDVVCSFIYGSFARGSENALSDIDLVVIGKCSEDKLIAGLDRFERILHREINYKLYTPAALRQDIAAKDQFLIHILKGEKLMLIGDSNALREILKSRPDKKGHKRSYSDEK